MSTQRINVKFFIQNADELYLPSWIPVFHQWIQRQAVPGLLIDLVDYKHVHNGPGLILIGHEADYAMDWEGGRPGLLVRRKRQDAAAALQEQLQVTLTWAQQARALLEEEQHLTFHDAFEISFPDRLNAPNTAEKWHEWQFGVAAALETFYPSSSFHLERLHEDSRRLLGYRVTWQKELTGVLSSQNSNLETQNLLPQEPQHV